MSRAALLKRLAAVEARYNPPTPTFVFQSFGETDAEFDASLREFTKGLPSNAVVHQVRLTFVEAKPGSPQAL
jgi:hypothetical protein